MIELKNISKIYHNSHTNNAVGLRGIDLKLTDTGLVFVVGPSGSGKSTLLNILSGLDTPTGGIMKIDGVDIRNFTAAGLDGYRTNYVGVVYQDNNLLEHLTLAQNVALAIEVKGKKAEPGDIHKLFERLNIRDLENRYPHEVSGGQAQRAAIARVLIKRPKILFTDELTSNLDTDQRDEVYKLLKHLSTEMLVIVTTHQREMMERFADRVITLESGSIKSDIFLTEDKTNLEVFGEGDVLVLESGSTLTSRDVELLNSEISKRNTEQLYLVLDTSIEKVKKGYPDEAKAIIQKTMEEKKKLKDYEKESRKRAMEQSQADGVFRFEKTRLPLRRSVGLGWAHFKLNKFRMIFTILLSVVSLSIFALATTLSAVNESSAIINSFSSSNQPYLSFRNDSQIFAQEDLEDWRHFGDGPMDFLRSSSLVHEISPEVTMTLPRLDGDASRPHEIFGIRHLMPLEPRPSPNPQQLNRFNQRLLYGRWPNAGTGPNSDAVNSVVISDFVASQIITARYAEGVTLTMEQMVETGQNQYLFNGGAMRFTIIGIYETEFIRFFQFDETNDKALLRSTNINQLIAPEMLALKPNLTRHEVAQAVYLMQNNWTTAFVSQPLILNITRNDNSGIHQLTNGFLNGNGNLTIGNFKNTEGVIVDASAYGFFITDHPSGLPRQRTPLYETIRNEGLIIQRGGSGLGQSTIQVSQRLWENLNANSIVPITNLHFSVNRTVRDLSSYYIQLPSIPLLRASTIETHIPIQQFNNLTITNERATAEDDHNLIVLSHPLYDRLMSSLIAPSTSLAFGNYGARQLRNVLDRMGDGAFATYMDSDAVSEFTQNFADIQGIMLAAAIIFGMLSIFLIFSYIMLSIRAKRKNIAIIRSLGAKTSDILIMFATEALILAKFIVLGALGLITLGMFIGNNAVQGSTQNSLMLFTAPIWFYVAVLGGAFLLIISSYLIPALSYARHRKNKGVLHIMKQKLEN